MGLTQTPLSGSAAALVGLVAFAAVALDVGWQFIQYGTVMAHEGAHAVVASLLFRKFDGIELKANSDGKTNWIKGGGCLGDSLIYLVGYLGPSSFGIGAARLIRLGHIAAVLWVALFLLGLLAIGLRWSFGVITVVLAGGLVYVIARYTPMMTQIVAAYAIAWLLLLSGVRGILRRGIGSGDGTDLRRVTGLPRLLWFLLWLAATVAAVAVGGKMLVMPT